MCKACRFRWILNLVSHALLRINIWTEYISSDVSLTSPLYWDWTFDRLPSIKRAELTGTTRLSKGVNPEERVRHTQLEDDGHGLRGVFEGKKEGPTLPAVSTSVHRLAKALNHTIGKPYFTNIYLYLYTEGWDSQTVWTGLGSPW